MKFSADRPRSPLLISFIERTLVASNSIQSMTLFFLRFRISALFDYKWPRCLALTSALGLALNSPVSGCLVVNRPASGCLALNSPVGECLVLNGPVSGHLIQNSPVGGCFVSEQPSRRMSCPEYH